VKKMAKEVPYEVCHLGLSRFLKVNWQKKAKSTVNSRGGLYELYIAGKLIFRY